MNSIALILPVFNGLSYTKECLKDITSSFSTSDINIIKIKIVVVDDGSTDGTYEWINSNYPEVIILKGDGNLWWSGAVNLAALYIIENLNYDYFLLWNNDIKCDENYFKNLTQIIKNIKEKVIIGSKIKPKEKPGMVWSMGGFFKPYTGKMNMYGFNREESDEFNKVFEADWLPGMGTLIPCSVVNEIGYWDAENFPQYFGDSDFTYRAKLNGYKLFVYPELVIWNTIDSSGLKHDGKLKNLFRSFTHIKSKYNIRKNIKFIRLYGKSPLSYYSIIKNYFMYISGFFKWYLLNIIGIKRK